MLQPVTPIVRIVESPTPEVSYGGLLLSAVGIVGVVLLLGLVAGLIGGALFISWRNRRAERTPAGSDAAQLNLSSLSKT